MARKQQADDEIKGNVQYGVDPANRLKGWQAPWTGLGVDISQLPRAEWAKAAGLDWKLERHFDFHGPDEGGSQVTRMPNRYIWVRDTDNKPFAACGHGWMPLQNEAVLDFVAEYSAAGGIVPEVAGALREGGLVFALARINKEFEVGKGDRIKSYLMFSSPHRVGEAIRVKTLTLRLICMNGLFTTNHAVEYSQSHIGMFDFAKARERVNFAHDELAEAEKRYKRIRALKMNIDDAMNKVLAPILAPELAGKVEIDNLPPKLAQIFQSIMTGPGAEPENGWGVLNGVSHWADHVAGRSPSSRLTSAWAGPNAMLKRKVEHQLLELA